MLVINYLIIVFYNFKFESQTNKNGVSEGLHRFFVLGGK
jgi:hypothetical protein